MEAERRTAAEPIRPVLPARLVAVAAGRASVQRRLVDCFAGRRYYFPQHQRKTEALAQAPMRCTDSERIIE
jgi:hypothetical protein